MGPRLRASLVVCAFLLVVILLPSRAAAQADCAALPDWFNGTVPSVPTFEPKTTCRFQQWAWQAFLGLLDTEQRQPTARYFTWPLPNPTITDLYCNGFCKIAYHKPPNPCGGPATQEVVNATTQPGFVRQDTSGELIDQNGKPVYFTAHVSPEWVAFFSQEQLFNPNTEADFDPRSSFPPGAFEIKSSWRIVKGMSQAERAQYYTTFACVVPEDQTIAPSQQEIALVGFHITGGAANHPELIWATFEHVRNAPDCQETPKAGSWAFYDGKTDCRQTKRCNQPNPAAGPAYPINVCRQSPSGGASPAVAREIASLNASVQAQLPRDSKLRFYELVGTVWAADPSPVAIGTPAPTVNLQDPAGSPLLANTSLETFKQNVSCFGCHNSQFPGEFAGLMGNSPVIYQSKTLFVSHIALFPFFFEADTRGGKTGCANTCQGAPATKPSHVPFQ